MKKALIIGGIALGVLLSAVIVIFIFFPGLLTYLKVKHDYGSLNRHITEFQMAEPSDSFCEYEANGLSYKVPAGWLTENNRSFKSTDGHSTFLALKQNLSFELSYDPWESYKYSEEDYRKLFEKLGVEVPEYDLSTRILWLAKDKITAKDCLKLRGKNLKVFRELAEIKNEAWDLENSWVIYGEGFTAYVGQMRSNGYDGNMWTVTVYPDSSKLTKYFVTINTPDKKTARQIISTIKLSSKETE
jgi:hypothetical protein